jgi:hypothetical protein
MVEKNRPFIRFHSRLLTNNLIIEFFSSSIAGLYKNIPFIIKSLSKCKFRFYSSWNIQETFASQKIESKTISLLRVNSGRKSFSKADLKRFIDFPFQIGSRRGSNSATSTEQENERLLQAIKTFGTSAWSQIALCVQSHSLKQCWERWPNRLPLSLKKDLLE